jgi:proline dehydrogenase
MVRGAFIHTEPERDLIHSSKEATDDAYDTAVAYLLGGQADGPQQVNRAFQTIESSLSTRMTPWRAELVLATHNSESLRKALNQYLQDNSSFVHPVSGIHRVGAVFGVQGIFFAQLMGMADEVSLKLATQIRKVSEGRTTDRIPKIGVYKYSVWGSLGECLLYLLRRAEENKDAVKRSRETALAIWRELFRRMLFFP